MTAIKRLGEVDRQASSEFEGEIREFMLTVNEHPNSDEALQAYIQKELGVRSRNDLGFRLIDQEGLVLVSSAVNDALRGIWKPPVGWTSDAPHVVCETLEPQGSAYPHRVCSLRVQTADGRACTAQTSYLLDQMTESLARVRRISFAILVFAPAALALRRWRPFALALLALAAFAQTAFLGLEHYWKQQERAGEFERPLPWMPEP